MSLPAAVIPERATEPPAATNARTSGPGGRRGWLWALLMVPPAVVAVHLLALGAFAGLSVRPAADDWCTVGWIQRYGFAGMVDHYYADVNGRLANGAAQVVIYASGLGGARLLPFALIVSLALGVFAAVYILLGHLRWRWPAAAAALVAVVVSALTYFAGNVVYQVIYWPAGTVSHTLPSILGVWNVVLALFAARSRRWVRVVAVALAGLTGFAIATLSEPFFLVSGVYAGAALALALLSWRDRRTRFPVAWLLAWIVGLLAGFALLYTSPGMGIRTARSRTQSSLLSASGFGEALSSWFHTWAAIASQPAYYAAIGVGLLAGLLASTSARRRTSLPFGAGSWRRVRMTLVVVLPAALVVVASFGVIAGLRQGYGPNGWLYERAWTNFLVPALLTAALYGAAGGYWLGGRIGGWRRAVALPAMGTLLAVAAVIGTGGLSSLVPANSELAREMTLRAKAWDKNDAAVEAQVDAGRRVVEFTPTSIASSTEPFTHTARGTDWVAGCAASYYGVDRIVPAKSWLSSRDSAVYRSKTGR